jgi:hypothetical protein
MELVPSIAGAAVAFVFGWFAAGYQHLLYREPEFHSGRATGRKLLVIRILLGASCAAAVGIALRPDHYDAGPALLTAAFSLALLVLASTDFERKRLPNRLMYPALVAALAFCWAWPDRDIQSILAGGHRHGNRPGSSFGEITGSSSKCAQPPSAWAT